MTSVSPIIRVYPSRIHDLKREPGYTVFGTACVAAEKAKIIQFLRLLFRLGAKMEWSLCSAFIMFLKWHWESLLYFCACVGTWVCSKARQKERSMQLKNFEIISKLFCCNHSHYLFVYCFMLHCK